MPKITDPNVLVGTETSDDAGVYRLDSRRALVVTTDFFSPVLDDPYDFGRVAAANALSDVYAMGGRPLLALNLVGFPSDALPISVLSKILEGGAAMVREAGAVTIGGHTVEDAEPKYGLAVVGEVSPSKLFTNVGVRQGDKLLLTKPIGSGIVTTAIKRGEARPKEIRRVTEVMTTLNDKAGAVLVANHASVHAVTDVTGYGLLGHLLEMLGTAKVGARLSAAAIPVLDAARRLAAAGVFPGGTRDNLKAAGRKVRFTGAMREDEAMQLIIADAQTSGGLLAAVAPRRVSKITSALEKAGVFVAEIGEIVEGGTTIVIDP